MTTRRGNSRRTKTWRTHGCFAIFFLKARGLNPPNVHALFESRQRDDFRAAKLLPATHLNFAHGKIRILKNKTMRCGGGPHQLPAPLVKRDGHNGKNRNRASDGQAPAPPARIAFAIVPAI